MPTGHYPRKPLTEETKIKIGNALRGRKQPEWVRLKHSQSHKNSPKVLTNALVQAKKASIANIGRIYSLEHRRKIKEANVLRYKLSEERIKASIRQQGEKGNNWKGGKTPINKRLRQSIEFRLWREAVFSRDNWTCQKCGKRGGKLHPHHIRSFSEFPELRFAIDNGSTLCATCHQSKHGQIKLSEVNYGTRSVG